MKKVRIGFVGAGRMGQMAHIACYSQIKDCELVGLAEGRAKTAQLVANHYGIGEVYGSLDEMLAKADLDAVVAIMGFNLHHSVVPHILEAGKHVLTEKPLCICPETGRRLAALAEEKGLIYHVGYMKRCDVAMRCAVKTIREWKESGICGKMNYVRITMPSGNWTLEPDDPIRTDDEAVVYEGEAPEPTPDWMDEATSRLYISFVNFWIHQVNALRYLLGEDYEVVYADPAGMTLTAMSALGVPCVLEMGGYGAKDHWEEFYKVCFERGKIDLKVSAPMGRQRAGEIRIFTSEAEGELSKVTEPILPQKWAFMEQARHFVRCVGLGEVTWS
ncbi:MAG: Gfo/Idh/MocA family oxidoreductase, partial [Phycisphaerae bacterium]|nr:Gfo/Idh/MocA family oxidoreductase [Phycisphaerae bacterium]